MDACVEYFLNHKMYITQLRQICTILDVKYEKSDF